MGGWWQDDEVPELKNRGRKQAQPAAAKGGSNKFAKGQSGNPAGRPKGARNRVTQLAEQMIGEDLEAIISKMVKLAKNGDRVAMRLVVDRVLPRARQRTEIDVPGIGASMHKASDIVNALGLVISSVSSGKMSLEEAKQFASILEVQRAAIETQDLQVRIEALEQGKDKGSDREQDEEEEFDEE